MKRIIGIVLALALVLAFGSLAAADDTAAWEVVAEYEVEHSVHVAGFYNETEGITAGYGGAMYYTTDGGETWQPGDNNSACRYGLALLEDGTAWTSGNYGHVRRSLDGGATWEAAENVSYTSVSELISFVDDQTGWVGSAQHIHTTTDGGQTWVDLDIPAELDRLIIALSVVSDTDAYILSLTRALWVTHDGGQTWDTLPITPLDEAGLDILSYPALRFFDAENGMLAARLKDDSIAVLRTTDGGATWTQELALAETPDATRLVLSPDGAWLTYTHGTSIRQHGGHFTLLHYLEEATDK
ncbi:MAG: hypothetical protein JXJ20_07450 [Anaerolineae bacterium]|nr:hypothetical protein [Anaerolineae bacterium]